MVLNRQRRVPFRRRVLAEFVARLEKEVAGGSEIAVCVVSDAAMRRLNRRFRSVDRATDVLSFPPNDVAISAETARRQARALGHGLDDELKVLALHGALHLAGYDHETDQGRMRRAERRLRKRMGLPLALTERR